MDAHELKKRKAKRRTFLHPLIKTPPRIICLFFFFSFLLYYAELKLTVRLRLGIGTYRRVDTRACALWRKRKCAGFVAPPAASLLLFRRLAQQRHQSHVFRSAFPAAGSRVRTIRSTSSSKRYSPRGTSSPTTSPPMRSPLPRECLVRYRMTAKRGENLEGTMARESREGGGGRVGSKPGLARLSPG